jgi:hypothetical protein
MGFLKKHYEKILLGLVLLGLALAAGFLPFLVSSQKQKLEDLRQGFFVKTPKPLTNLDLTVPTNALKRMATIPVINFSTKNKLFNPMPWQKRADGTLVPSTKVGPTAASITNVAPLYLKITLDSVTVSDNGPHYVIGIEKEAARNPAQRPKKQAYCSLNSKNDTFVLVGVNGKPDDPSQLVLELNDTGEKVTISKDKPFQRIDGYIADVRYDPENRKFPHCRVGSALAFGGEEYNVVAIAPNEVVISAKSNQKKWTIKNNPT